MRLNFVEPLLPTLVDKPPEGGEWIHASSMATAVK